jgi:hypothetical protein
MRRIYPGEIWRNRCNTDIMENGAIFVRWDIDVELVHVDPIKIEIDGYEHSSSSYRISTKTIDSNDLTKMWNMFMSGRHIPVAEYGDWKNTIEYGTSNHMLFFRMIEDIYDFEGPDLDPEPVIVTNYWKRLKDFCIYPKHAKMVA